jgi:hypothetical protein
VGQFGLDHRTFDNHVVDFLVIVSLLSFVFKVGIGASYDGVDHAVGGELLLCCRGSRICNRGGRGRLGTGLF